ncbi:MAG: hypothetical protein Q7P63_01270 [Verrucomicrobiota bacterium JB022]|nr:hypothetical protein [Verrucomicrobiota bacterium JB022]
MKTKTHPSKPWRLRWTERFESFPPIERSMAFESRADLDAWRAAKGIEGEVERMNAFGDWQPVSTEAA